MAELTNERFVDLMQITDQYVRQMGGYEVEDLLAAGFEPGEIAEFEDVMQRLRVPAPPSESQTFVRADKPTRRERHAAALAKLFGGEDYDRGDLLLARRFTGSADPTSTQSFGLADLVGYGALYGVEEAGDTAAQGVRSGDIGKTVLGVGQAGLEALGALPGVALGAKTADKLIDAALDTARRAEADRFFREAEEAAEGASGAAAAGERVFVPSEDELSMISGNPTPREQDYLYYRKMSRNMADSGDYTPDEILEATGFLRMPVTGMTGQLLGEREVFVGGLEGLRKTDRPDIEFVPQKELGKNVWGEFDPDTQKVRISEDLDLLDSMQVAEHETAHFDLFQALSDPKQRSEVGSSEEAEQFFLRNKVKELRAMLKDPSLDDNARLTVQALLDDIRKNESAAVNYENNPGEILARAASGERRTSQLVSPKQLLNPYINQEQFDSNLTRGIDALLMKARPDLWRFMPESIGRSLQPPAISVPMDIRRGQVNDPEYVFSPRP